MSEYQPPKPTGLLDNAKLYIVCVFFLGAITFAGYNLTTSCTKSAERVKLCKSLGAEKLFIREVNAYGCVKVNDGQIEYVHIFEKTN